MTKLLCHHGSPGTVRDFAEVAHHLKNIEILPQERGALPCQEPHYLLGYSWGSLLALRDAIASPHCLGVILVSPYFSTEKPKGVIAKIVLKLVLSLSPLRAKFVRDFLAKTASPQKVPSSYQALSEKIGEKLYQSLVEKGEVNFDVNAAVQTLHNRPLLVIFGNGDRVSGTQETITHLKSICPSACFSELKEAGHALLWTHPQEISTIIARFISSPCGG